MECIYENKKTMQAAIKTNTSFFSVEQCSTKSHDQSSLPAILSLFSGAGGLDLGFKHEGFEISLAIDISQAAIKSHKRNFPNSNSVCANLIDLGPQGVLDALLKKIPPKTKLGVIGGPPCQGFSRANNQSTADDPRNTLPKLYIEIIKKLQEVFEIEFIVFENVLGIRDKKHAQTYSSLVHDIDLLGFHLNEHELCATDFGVPQTRKRIILAAMRKGKGYLDVVPRKNTGVFTVKEAIGGIESPVFYSKNIKSTEIPVHPNHWTMKPKSYRFSTPMEKWSTSCRSFKVLKWDRPSPTIAFGNREIHVHPSATRRISIYEALILQGFPKNFVLEGNLSEQVEQVSNAVPPPVARSVAAAVKHSLLKEKHEF